VDVLRPWVDGVVGAMCIVASLLRLWRRRRPGPPARWSIWNSVALGALGLCAWFSAAASLGHMAGLWYLLVMASALIALCAGMIALTRSPALRR
jgi:hypothetical protein